MVERTTNDVQIVTGAPNNENCYSIGQVNGEMFMANGCGMDLVITSMDFKRIQMIPNVHVGLIDSVDCCQTTGKIAVCNSHQIIIFEPFLDKDAEKKGLNYQWSEAHSMVCVNTVLGVHWYSPQHLLVSGHQELFLYETKALNHHVKFTISTEETQTLWEVTWRKKLLKSVKYLKISSDGSYFATAGENDRFVKIWYPLKDFKSFSFVVLCHPSPVCGFEWRQTSRFVPKGGFPNILITWNDSTSQVWKEFPSNCDGVVRNYGFENSQTLMGQPVKEVDLCEKLSRIIEFEKRRDLGTNYDPMFSDLKENFGQTSTEELLPTFIFKVVLSIDARNDMFLDNANAISFALHWLNNKEICFSRAIQETLGNIKMEQKSSETFEEYPNNATAIGQSKSVASFELKPHGSDITHSKSVQDFSAKGDEKVISGTEKGGERLINDALDLTLLNILRQWKNSFDILFAVHPTDGSVVCWVVEFLDHPFRQPTLSFSSKLPNAFPAIFADSLKPHCLNTLVLNSAKRSHSPEEKIISKGSTPSVESSTYLVNMITYHDHDGSLNLWDLMLDQRHTAIVSVSLKSFLRGHRFTISEISPHPTQPLLLTVSHHLSENSADQMNPSNKHFFELIFWALRTGRVRGEIFRELVRITIDTPKSFSHYTWVPSTMHSFGDADGIRSCFVSSDGNDLLIFSMINDINQTMLKHDDKNDLGSNAMENISDSRSKVVFSSSTYRLLMRKLEDSSHASEKILLLHVFDESLVRGSISGAHQENHFICVCLTKNEQNQVTNLNMWLLKKDRNEMLGFSVSKVYCKSLDFGNHIQVVSCAPSANHLSSCNFYPLCKPLYLITLLCSDDKLRFLMCEKDNALGQYQWTEWNQPFGADSNICLVSNAHAGGRFAAATFTPIEHHRISFASFTRLLEFSVFECETSGGSEWLREDSFHLANQQNEQEVLSSYFARHHITNEKSLIEAKMSTLENLLKINWVNIEDGRYLLAVQIGPLVYIYAQISHDMAQNNIVRDMVQKDINIKPSGKRLLRKNSYLTASIPTTKLMKWICLRILELPSDGFSIPIGWIRNGLVIIGLHSELHVYNQWNLASKIANSILIGASSKGNPRIKSVFKMTASNLLGTATHHKSHSTFAEMMIGKRTMDRTMSSKIVSELLSHALSTNRIDPGADKDILEAIHNVGLFDAAKLANPLLPQYHPKLLTEMLNTGKTNRVKAILLHVLRTLKLHLSTKDSQRRQSLALSETESNNFSISRDEQPASLMKHRRESFGGSFKQRPSFGGTQTAEPEYEELEYVSPLHLHMLLASDEQQQGKNAQPAVKDVYESLFEPVVDPGPPQEDSALHASKFTKNDSISLAECLTHIHLPGLASMDQMHLLAIADTISHFEGPAVEAVDECGLRFLMSKKQFDYLLRCLSPVQRKKLFASGLPSSSIIWAFHSDCEQELLNSIACFQKGEETWDEFRLYGVAWWLKNPASMRSSIERVAKNAFQQNQNPMDASLFYLALGRKNVLAQLFKSVNDSRMFEFFREDFSQEKWKKAALKNAFVLMSKQRHHHAAAFFLLAGSLKDALQIILSKINDLQLAIVVLRLFEANPEKQSQLMLEMLDTNVLSYSTTGDGGIEEQFPANKDPFLRSMCYWIIKDYENATETLLKADIFLRDQSRDGGADSMPMMTVPSLSDICNFYVFLRRHPLVLRQRLTNEGLQTFSTEQFLKFAEQISGNISDSERRLYFRTASTHLALGCPLLALEILYKLPTKNGVNGQQQKQQENGDDSSSKGSGDSIAQHLMLFAFLQILTDELETLATGFEHDGGQLRFNLFKWLENECRILDEICCKDQESLLCFDENAKQDPSDRKRWLHSHQGFLVTLIHYSSIHSAQNFHLIPIQMELNLIQLETEASQCLGAHAINDLYSLPLLGSTLFTSQTAVTPSEFIKTQLNEIFQIVLQFHEPPAEINFSKLYALYNMAQGLSACVFQSLSGFSILTCPFSELNGPLTSIARNLIGINSNLAVTSPSNWPGVEELLHLFGESIESQHLRLMLIESFVAIVMSIFCYSFALSDSRWLYRLCAHRITSPHFFAEVFGGGGEKRSVSSAGMAPPSRPPPPKISSESGGGQQHHPKIGMDSATIRARLHARVFGAESVVSKNVMPPPASAKPIAKSGGDGCSDSATSEESTTTTAHCWVPPKRQIIQYLADKVLPANTGISQPGGAFDSDDENVTDDEEDEDDAQTDRLSLTFDKEKSSMEQQKSVNPREESNTYAWLLMRLAMIWHLHNRITEFIVLSGFEPKDLLSASSNLETALKLLRSWAANTEELLYRQPSSTLDSFMKSLDPSQMLSLDSEMAPIPAKYNSLMVQSNNTPFNYSAKGIKNVRRLWSYLVSQDELVPYFVKFIFARILGKKESISAKTRSGTSTPSKTPQTRAGRDAFETLKIVQKEHEPILSFVCNSIRPGCVAISTAKEIQEMDIEKALEERDRLHRNSYQLSLLNNHVELALEMRKYQRDTLFDNDDYLLVTESGGGEPGEGADGGAESSFPSTAQVQSSPYPSSKFIVERSRFCLKKLRKRRIAGVRRLEPHMSMPYYASGSSDGSVFLWEWGVEHPIFTARVAGQYAKVMNIAFPTTGNRFAIVDGDGILCVWNASHGVESQKPYFSTKCHSKVAFDVKFLGETSTLLCTAGLGETSLNLWDTLMPPSKSLVQSFVGHSEGVSCVTYLADSQTIVSGGRRGEINVWDLRRLDLRATIKAFESPSSTVKCMVTDPLGNLIAAGSSEGEIKIWTDDFVPLYTFSNEHTAKSGFSLRNIGASAVQGVQQLHLDSARNLFSCGADSSVIIRKILPIILNQNN